MAKHATCHLDVSAEWDCSFRHAGVRVPLGLRVSVFVGGCLRGRTTWRSLCTMDRQGDCHAVRTSSRSYCVVPARVARSRLHGRSTGRPAGTAGAATPAAAGADTDDGISDELLWLRGLDVLGLS